MLLLNNQIYPSGRKQLFSNNIQSRPCRSGGQRREGERERRGNCARHESWNNDDITTFARKNAINMPSKLGGIMAKSLGKSRGASPLGISLAILPLFPSFFGNILHFSLQRSKYCYNINKDTLFGFSSKESSASEDPLQQL